MTVEKDERGKTTVTKLGIGAKQRDGFEYEFTCSFLLDQKTNTATSQKDNTHIFEGETATLLTENHGRKNHSVGELWRRIHAAGSD